VGASRRHRLFNDSLNSASGKTRKGVWPRWSRTLALVPGPGRILNLGSCLKGVLAHTMTNALRDSCFRCQDRVKCSSNSVLPEPENHAEND
jgi:hypothetical protein